MLLTEAILLVQRRYWPHTTITMIACMTGRSAQPNDALANWLAAYRKLVADRDRLHWVIADWIVEGRRAGLPVTATEVAANLDLSHVKLREQYRVATAFPTDQRNEHVPFDAHRQLAALPKDQRCEALIAAAREGWGERQARKLATAYRQERGGFQDEDYENSQAVQIMRAWNRASPEARQYFAEMQVVVGLGLVDEDAACG